MDIYIFFILEIFNAAYKKVCCMEKAVNGFKSTGIFPINPDVFTEEDFINDSENLSMEQPVEAGDTDVILDVNLPVVDLICIRADSQEENDASTNENNPDLQNQSHFTDPESSFDVFLKELVAKPAALPKPTSTKRGPLKRLHSEILTSPESKKVLETKRRVREEKIKKGDGIQKKKELNAKKELKKLKKT